MNDLDIIKKLSNNNNLGIPYLYYYSNINKNIIKDFNHIYRNYNNLDDKIYNNILNLNIYKINNKTKNNKIKNKNKKTKKFKLK